MSVTPYDISIQFNTVNPANPTEILDSCRVFLSPQHTKVFCMLLGKNLDQFEKFSGSEIAVSPELLKSLSMNDDDEKEKK